MLINNNTQALSTVEKLKRPDMDPANAAASRRWLVHYK